MSQIFEYDALDRLEYAVGTGQPNGYPPQVFAYDAHGNRQTTITGSYAYAPGNPFRLQSVSGGPTLQYDANGNLTGGLGTFTFTPDNLVSSATVGGTTT